MSEPPGGAPGPLLDATEDERLRPLALRILSLIDATVPRLDAHEAVCAELARHTPAP